MVQKNRRARAKVDEQPVQETEEVEVQDTFEDGVPVSGLDLLDAMNDEEGPSVEEIDASAKRGRRTAIPDGEYVARLNRYEIGTQTNFFVDEDDPQREQPAFVGFMSAHGVISNSEVEDRYVGAYLPVLRSALVNDVGPRGNRVDGLFWSIADAVLTPDRRRELQQEAGSKYSAQVRAVLEELDEAINDGYAYMTVYKFTQRFERRDGTPGERHKIARVSPLPEDLEPLERVEDNS